MVIPAAGAVLDTTAPRASTAQVEGLVRSQYGLACRASLLFSERDQHFRLDAADGRTLVFRIANASEDQTTTNLQTAALLHIAQSDPALPVPRVVFSSGGLTEIAVVLDGTRHLARLLTYVDGVPLHQTAPSPDHRQRLGATLARLGLALRGFSNPAGCHHLLWDLKQAAEVRPMAAEIADLDCRRAALAVLDRFTAEVRPRLSALRSQVVHNDFSLYNVLVHADDPGLVSGILDFGDLVRTQLVNDVAIGACYQVDTELGLLQGEANFVLGYHRAVPLTSDELDVLLELIKLRHVLTVSITETRARRYPDNAAYIVRNHARAARGLAMLESLPRQEGTALLRHFCGQ